MRELNKLLTAIMEGRTAPGQESYSDFLIARSRDIAGISEEDRKVFELWIAVRYGDKTKPRVVPYKYARLGGMFAEDVARLERQAEENYEQKQAEFDAISRKARKYEFEKLMKEVGNYCVERGIEGYERWKKIQWVYDVDKERQKEHAEDVRKNRARADKGAALVAFCLP